MLSIGMGKFMLISLLAFMIMLTPTGILGLDNFGNPCNGDVLAAYEQAGAHLQSVIPDGSTVYWGGSSVVTPLLGITDTEFHPQLLNGIYSARRGGDRDLLEKAGFYNQDSLQAWRASDEFILLENIYVSEFWKNYLSPETFNEYQPTGPINPCEPDSTIRIYRRK